LALFSQQQQFFNLFLINPELKYNPKYNQILLFSLLPELCTVFLLGKLVTHALTTRKTGLSLPTDRKALHQSLHLLGQSLLNPLDFSHSTRSL
jgi:hypothetical protein